LVHARDEVGPGALLVSRQEAEIWPCVDGKRGVREILDQVFLSDLDAYRGLSELLDRGLVAPAPIDPASRAKPRPRTPRISARAIGLWAVLLLLLASAVRQLPRNPLNVFLRSAGERPETRELFKSVSLARLASVERAVRVYYDSSGRYPTTLQDLLESGVLTAEGATDPYGRLYRYILRPEEGKFRIYGRDAQGDIDLDLSFERSLAPVAESKPVSSPEPEKQPGVRVVK
jgi:Bacterial type II secretion system protein G.